MDDRPQLLLMRDFPALLMEGLARDFVLHRLWQAEDRDRFVAGIAGEVRAIVSGSTVGVPRALVECLPRLELIACFGVGVDLIDVAHARARGVVVTNTPDVLNEDVADMAIALLFAAARRIPLGDRFVRAGRWPQGPMPFSCRVHGKVAGIVGLGRIGGAVARRLEAFGCTILYHGPHDKAHPRHRYCPDLAAMAGESDFLLLTCIGGDATCGLVGTRVLEALGPEGILVNVARGSVVDERALIEALTGGRLLAAGLDVFADEPRVPAALLGLDNVVLSPHQASATHETRAAMAALVMENVRAHFAGRPVPNPVC